MLVPFALCAAANDDYRLFGNDIDALRSLQGKFRKCVVSRFPSPFLSFPPLISGLIARGGHGLQFTPCYSCAEGERIGIGSGRRKSICEVAMSFPPDIVSKWVGHLYLPAVCGSCVSLWFSLSVKWVFV
ncbi:hypothetical protein NL676_011411 [Syzygium grande]|nr:hypothetical protein NL676_011411 [Syzygium grande]